MTSPTVSIVVPTHNRPELLQDALRSVLAQTFGDFEVIVADDGDLDSAAQNAVTALGDARIHVVRTTRPHSGGSAARNAGAKAATGNLIAFLDDDDEWFPQKLERQLAALRGASPETAYCFSSVIMDYDGATAVNSVPDEEGDFSERALRRFSGTMTSSLLIRRDAFFEIGGFDESFPSHQEAELMIRLANRYRGIGIAEPLVRMKVAVGRDHVGGSIDRRIKGRVMLLAKHAERYAAYPALLAQHYYWLAFLYRDAGRKQDALQAFNKAWKVGKRLRYLLRLWVFRLTGR